MKFNQFKIWISDDLPANQYRMPVLKMLVRLSARRDTVNHWMRLFTALMLFLTFCFLLAGGLLFVGGYKGTNKVSFIAGCVWLSTLIMYWGYWLVYWIISGYGYWETVFG